MTVSQTPLERQLDELDVERPSPVGVLRIARHQFARDRRIDMGALAVEAGVSRATLYRWVGSREKLLGEVLFAMADAAFTRAEEDVGGAGARRVLGVLERFFDGVLAPGPYRGFLEDDAEVALRLCASKQGPVQRRVIRRIQALLEVEDVTADGMSTHDLAYALLRIGESFIYSDVITGDQANLAPARAVWRLMLGQVPPAAAPACPS